MNLAHAQDPLTPPGTRPDRGEVLTKAVLRAADVLGLKASELARIIGVSPATISRMKQGRLHLKDGTKEFELAALLVRIYRSLFAIAGGDEKVMKHWMRAVNAALGSVPAELVQRVTGLVDVVAYLDSRRAVV